MFKARLLLIPLVLVGAVACDADDDGLSNRQEKAYGTDKDNADSDGDGLLDGDEVARQTDPLNADFDGDGYSDGFEVASGTDPRDPTSGYYQGGWPYNPNKDAIEDPGLSGTALPGATVPNLTLKDQFGDDVELYDFAGQDKLIAIDVSAGWCGPCRSMAGWLDGGSDRGFAEFNGIRDAVDDGDVIWITVLSEGWGNASATEADVDRWYNLFPHDEIPVLQDDNYAFMNWTGLEAFPTVIYVDQNMEIIAYNGGNWGVAMDALNDDL